MKYTFLLALLLSIWNCSETQHRIDSCLENSWYTFYPSPDFKCEDSFLPYLSELIIDPIPGGYKIYEIHPNLLVGNLEVWEVNESRKKGNKWFFLEDSQSQYIQIISCDHIIIRRLLAGTLNSYLTLNYRKQKFNKNEIKVFFSDENAYQDINYCRGLWYLSRDIEEKYCSFYKEI